MLHAGACYFFFYKGEKGRGGVHQIINTKDGEQPNKNPITTKIVQKKKPRFYWEWVMWMPRPNKFLAHSPIKKPLEIAVWRVVTRKLENQVGEWCIGSGWTKAVEEEHHHGVRQQRYPAKKTLYRQKEDIIYEDIVKTEGKQWLWRVSQNKATESKAHVNTPYLFKLWCSFPKFFVCPCVRMQE